MLDRLFTHWRVKWYSVSVLFAMSLGFLICIFSGKGSMTITARLGGDYPAFYSIGRIVSKGKWKDIYNHELQAAEQKSLMGEETSFLPFGYPPYITLFYWPLSLLPYRLSYSVHTVLMSLALLYTLHLIRPMSEEINKHFLAAFTVALCFSPIFRAITAGQNTILTMLLIALSWRAIEEKHEYLAGIFTGLMLFKPQFALPLIGVFLLSGRWRLGITSGIVAVILYIIGTLMIGPDWVIVWLQKANWQVQRYAVLDKLVAVSWLGFFEAVLGGGNKWALIAGWSLTIFTIVAISWIWLAGGQRADLMAQMGLLSVCLVLIPPHVIFYDMGILLFTYVAVAAKPLKRKMEILVIICIISWSQPILAHSLGFSPLFIVAIGTGILAIYTLKRPALEPLNKS